MHESFESPAAIELWCNKNNAEISFTRFYNGEVLPTNIDFDILFVMGGPQSPATTTDECIYFDVTAEIQFIKKVIDANKIVLGVCLGAQLIGEALGAKFEHSPHREIGVFDINLTEEAAQDAVFSNFPTTFRVGHWHGDMPGLTKDAKVLAYSEGCPRQVVKYSSKIYGFQCHFEFNTNAIEGMIDNSKEELEKYKNCKYVETKEQLLEHNYSEINNKLFLFLDYLKSQISLNG